MGPGMVIAAVNARLRQGPEPSEQLGDEFGELMGKGTDIIDELLEVRDENGDPLAHADILSESIGGDTAGK